MPEIARFYGIIIRIFYEAERHQLPHFHAAYGEYVASFTIEPPALLAGLMPRKQHILLHGFNCTRWNFWIIGNGQNNNCR